jgi:hypothetical protein
MFPEFREHEMRRNSEGIKNGKRKQRKEPERAEFECFQNFGSMECGEIVRVSKTEEGNMGKGLFYG